MMRHIVLFRRKREFAKDDALERSLTARMASLGHQIPAIRGWVFRAVRRWYARLPHIALRTAACSNVS